MKKIIVIFCVCVCMIFTGCATSREKLAGKCAEFEKTRVVPGETTFWDSLLWSLVGFSAGAAAGGALLVAGTAGATGSETMYLFAGLDYAAMIAGAVVGWNFPGWGEKKFTPAELEKTCGNLKNNRYCGLTGEEDIPSGYFYKKTGLFEGTVIAEKGSGRTYDPFSGGHPDFIPINVDAAQYLEDYKNKTVYGTAAGIASLVLIAAGGVVSLYSYSVDVDFPFAFMLLPIPAITLNEGDQTAANVLKIAGLGLAAVSAGLFFSADSDMDRSIDGYNKALNAKQSGIDRVLYICKKIEF